MTTWNKRIKEAREEAGMANSDLARAVGVKPASVTLWENGSTKNMDAANCIKACEVLGIRPQWLVFGRGPKHVANSKLVRSIVATLEGLSEDDLRRADAVLHSMFEGMQKTAEKSEPMSPSAIEQKYSPEVDATGVQDGTGIKTGSETRAAGRRSR